MAKPTEGPYVVDNNRHAKTLLIKAPNGNIIAELWTGGINEEWSAQQHLHARLLAKSWEMREALNSIIERLVRQSDDDEKSLDLMALDYGGDFADSVQNARALLREIDGDSQ